MFTVQHFDMLFFCNPTVVRSQLESTMRLAFDRSYSALVVYNLDFLLRIFLIRLQNMLKKSKIICFTGQINLKGQLLQFREVGS